MILTDLYRFERLAVKAKSRMDCTASTHSYPGFEDRKATRTNKETEKRDATDLGDLVVYYNNVPMQFGGSVHRKADKSITIKGQNLSSVYVPDVAKNIGYGDFKGTSDALLFVFHNFNVVDGVIQPGGVIEVFVAKGKSRDCVALFELFSNGQLDEEMDELRKNASLTDRGRKACSGVVSRAILR